MKELCSSLRVIKNKECEVRRLASSLKHLEESCGSESNIEITKARLYNAMQQLEEITTNHINKYEKK